MTTKASFAFLVLVYASVGFSQDTRSFVEDKTATNKAFLVGVGHGLPGIDIDVINLEKLSTNDSYKFEVSKLMEEEGTVEKIAEGLTAMSSGAGKKGTAFFYFSGHGNIGLIWPEDKDMTVEEIRDAIEVGREGKGPLKRLVLMFDTCHAGSLLDPMKLAFPISQDARVRNALFADDVVRKMEAGRNGERAYWNKLMVFASSLSDESSMAGQDGSRYTNAMMKAFDEVSKSGGTIGEFQDKSVEYTKGHTPIARFVPESLKDEKLTP